MAINISNILYNTMFVLLSGISKMAGKKSSFFIRIAAFVCSESGNRRISEYWKVSVSIIIKTRNVRALSLPRYFVCTHIQ